MTRAPLTSLLALSVILSGCGGSGGGGSAPVVATTGPSGAPAPSAGCTLRDRQDWAAAQLREWYLFPETLPASLDPATYTSVQAYVDALTATARGQRRDRNFTYVTSIAQENAFYASGSSAGFGIRLSTDGAAGRVFVAEAFEGAPALAQGIDRGTEILAIGTNAGDLRTVRSIITAEGGGGVTAALGPNTAGVTRVLRVTDGAGQRDVTVSKADYALAPVSERYGARIIEDGGRQVGYVNLRTFISTADAPLRNAFATFRARNVTDVIIDVRYNGGGLVSIAELVGDLLGRARTGSEALNYTTYRPEKASRNSTRLFQPRAESIAPTRVAFIGTAATASASELIVNDQIPYLRANAALIGTNTFGKPVGQIAVDRAACDDRLRIVAFATQNAARQGNYFDGLATVVEASCQAADDLGRPLGDPAEGSVRAALDFIAGRPCNRISVGDAGTLSTRSEGKRELLTPANPDTAQREVPGLF